MKIKTVTLLHPGNMGATIGASVTGARVLWVSGGRSEGTRRRADKSGLLEAATLAEAVGDSDAVLSVCPPHAAEDVAQSVAALGFAGLYVDANAVSRATAQRVGEAVQEGGAAFVDGAIIGPPSPSRTGHACISPEQARMWWRNCSRGACSTPGSSRAVRGRHPPSR